jgi:glycosyltransferase involved in cell wall biosynthesis
LSLLKTHVLFVNAQTAFGADSAVTAMLARHLDRDRFVVHVACAATEGAEEAASLAKFREIPDIHLRPTHFAPGFRQRSAATIARQLRPALASPFEVARLTQYMRRHGIRIVHGTDRPRDSMYALALARLGGARSVVHVHVAWSRYYSAAARWGVRNADGVFAISRFVANTVVETGTPQERVHTVLNGIDPSRWDPATPRDDFRRELSVPLGAPLLASVSRLFGEKGQRELLRAFALVRREVPDVWLAVVGADALDVHGSSFTAELKQLAKELGILDRVLFTGERSDVPRVMAAADVFTMPSYNEPFGLVFLEAMAMRRPVVAVNNGGTPEVVEDGRSGFLVSYKDVETLAARIVTLLRQKDLRERMGDYGRARVLDYFNARRMADDAGLAYEAILRVPRTEPRWVQTSG